MRSRVVLVAVLAVVLSLLTVGCDQGPTAPDPGEASTVCAETSFCIGQPEGWEVVDVGPRHVTISHELGAEASVGFVDMAGVVTAAGGTWPQSAERVARSMWALFDGGEAELDDLAVARDGSVSTEGDISTGAQFHLLVPLEGSEAVGVVVRAPNRSWRTHVDLIYGGLQLLP